MTGSDRTRDAPPGHLEALQELHRISADADMDLEAKMADLLDLGRSYLDLPIGFVSEVDPESDRFEVVAALGGDDLLEPGATAPLSETYCRRTVASGGLLGVRDLPAAGWEGDPAHEAYDLGCYLGGTIAVDGDTYGTLCFAGASPREGPFTDVERTFVELLTQSLSHELARAAHERLLREERDFVQDVLDTLDDGVFVIDEGGTFLRWNDHLTDDLGYDDAEIERMTPSDFFRDADADRVAAAVGEVLETGEARLVATLVTADGERVPYELRAGRFTGPDGRTLVCGVGRDVSEREAHEAELARYETIVETMDDAAWIVDRDGRLSLVNERFTTVVGTFEGAALGRPLEDLLDGATDADALSAYVDRLEAVLAGEDDGFRLDLPLAFGLDHGVVDVRVAPMTVTGSIEGAVAVARDVTQQRRREERLRQFENAIENVEGLVYALDAHDRFTIVTPGFADRLGYDRAALLGEHVSLVLTEESVATRAERLDASEEGEGGLASYEAEAATAEGERFPVRVDLSRLPGDEGERGTVAAVTDLTELAATRRELDDERDRYEFLFENVPDPVVEARIVDGEPVIAAVNGAFEETFGYDPGDALGRSVNELLVPPGNRDAARDIDERALAGEETLTEVRRETTGGLRDFLFRGVIFSSDGETRGIGIYTDITDQKRRERYLTVLARVLRHNLRNDLNVVMGQAGLVAERIDDEDLAERARAIERTARHLIDLSTDAREIEAALDPGDAPSGPTDVVSTLESVARQRRDAHPEATIEVDATDVPPAFADGRLRRAVDELVENAIEHAGPDVRVELSAVSSSEKRVSIAVADDGPGIPEIERDVVSGEAEITPLSHGSGLGLWVAKWIVDSYGGDLSFDGSDGTTVTLELRAVESG